MTAEDSECMMATSKASDDHMLHVSSELPVDVLRRVVQQCYVSMKRGDTANSEAKATMNAQAAGEDCVGHTRCLATEHSSNGTATNACRAQVIRPLPNSKTMPSLTS